MESGFHDCRRRWSRGTLSRYTGVPVCRVKRFCTSSFQKMYTKVNYFPEVNKKISNFGNGIRDSRENSVVYESSFSLLRAFPRELGEYKLH